MTTPAHWLWDELRDLFEVDDGSLPEIRVNFVNLQAVADGYALLRARACRTVDNGFWSELHHESRSLDSVPNAAALVVSGEAEPFHVLCEGIVLHGVTVPDLGVLFFPDQIALDYRMGGWTPEKLEALFGLLFDLVAADPAASLSLEEGTARSVEARFQRAWARYVMDRRQ